MLRRLPAFLSVSPIHAPPPSKRRCRRLLHASVPPPKTGVSAAIFRRSRAGNSSVLLVKRGKQLNYGLWALPGGALDPGETMLEGVLREVREETGIDNKMHDLRVLDTPAETVLVGDGKWRLFVFAGICAEGAMPIANDDATDAVFCDVEQIGGLQIVEGLEKVVRKAEALLKNESGWL